MTNKTLSSPEFYIKRILRTLIFPFAVLPRFHNVARLIILTVAIVVGSQPVTAFGQEPDYGTLASEIVADMTVEERVGQLFLVTFEGSDALISSDIADLILNYNIGGVLYLAENDNIVGQDNSAEQIAFLSNALQQLTLTGTTPFTSTESVEDEPGAESTPVILPPPPNRPLPLFIAIAHEGDGPPFTEIYGGLTTLPNQMAVGATWQPEFSEAVGKIAGEELKLIGVNMILGPSLDVLENPSPLNPSDLGTRTFGGDPYWVGLMGQAYISGIHQGSDERVAVIAKHFPGYGSSDRPINEEIGTVRKSLEQLKQIELAPFVAVTGNAASPKATADGLLTAHIRYQGFQGNIRATTAPVSFDPHALSSLMALPEFQTWRQEGGVIVSDKLGVRAVQRFYDASGVEFPHRQVAKDALLAGNDILLLSDFALGEADYQDELANIKDTIEWFREKYRTDQTFQQRIDEAILQNIQLKLKLYQANFDLENVIIELDLIDEDLGQNQDTTFTIANDAITLIAPSIAEVDQLVPPNIGDNIVIFTDVRQARQCTSCPSVPYIGEEDLEQRMLALYGPNASEQVQPQQISSFSFEELKAFLTFQPPIPTLAVPADGTVTPDASSDDDLEITLTPSPTPTPHPAGLVETALQQADWVIFATLRPDPEAPDSDALSLFLAQRPDIAKDAKVITFAYNAPYVLDTTEISQLTAYYGVYAKSESFIDASVRALFQESSLPGRPPVNIDGIGYDLFDRTRPDPAQVIELYIVDEETLKSPPGEAPLEVVPGSTLKLQTGRILDHNGNPVPDGTPVEFVQQDRIQGFVNVIAEKPTINGVANLDYLLEARAGNFRITANAGDAFASQEIDIVIGENAVVSINTPTATPTHTPAPTNTPTPSLTPTPIPTTTPSPTPMPTATPEPPPEAVEEILMFFLVESQTLLVLSLGIIVSGSAGYLVGKNEKEGAKITVRSILWAIAGALVAYNYYALSLPGFDVVASREPWSILLFILAGGATGIALFYILNRGKP